MLLSMIDTPKPPRTLSKDGSIHVTDEFYNTLISSTGAILAIIGTVFLVDSSINAHKPWHTLSFLVYGSCVLSLFVSSALHHWIDRSPRINHFLRELDYCCIYLMIAGTFTPFCLIMLRGRFGWIVLGLMWSLATLGILLKVSFSKLPKWVSVMMYIGMGWLSLIIVKPIYQYSPQGLLLLVIGGLIFTVGAGIFFIEKPNPIPGRFGFHEIWHLFVLAGAASHFFVMCLYVLPLP